MTADAMFPALFSSDAVLAATGDSSWIRAMLDFEDALAQAEASVGIISIDAAREISTVCRSVHVDPSDLGRQARASGNPVVPLVALLSSTLGGAGRGYVHFGATSQDVLDTAAVLITRRSVAAIVTDLRHAQDAAAGLADHHRETIMIGRTLLQQALPIPFGLKAAGWLVAILEATDHLEEVTELLPLQFGGAAGTLASLGVDGPNVAHELARRLELAEAPLPWHTDRVRLVEVTSALGVAAGACGKVALDVALLMQNEVNEAAEGKEEGRGGSSTMPHKRNPVECTLVDACARRATGLVGIFFSSLRQEHERAIGAWHAEWETLGELLRTSGGAASGCREILQSLEVHPDQMIANLESTRGVLFAERVMLDLAPTLGRSEAHHLVEAATRRAVEDGRELRDVLGEDEAVANLRTSEELDFLFDSSGYLGASSSYIDAALAAFNAYRRTEQR